jgi:hypothetical protein
MSAREDAVRVSAIAWNEPETLLFAGARHIRCSPSRAQHIVHPDFEPVVDDRYIFDKRLWTDPDHPVCLKHGPDYVKECERRYTEAWVQLQDECDLEEVKEKAFLRSKEYLDVQKRIKDYKLRQEEKRKEDSQE